MEDNNSKFGTLILLKKPFKLKDNIDVTIQTGRSVLSFKVNTKKELKW